MKALFIGFVIFALFVTYMYMSKSKPDDVWTKYGVKPFVLDDMDDWMKALNIYRETYEKVQDVNDKIVLRMGLEETRGRMLELYKEKGEEMGLDSDTAVEFSRDMIRYNKI
jgi:hypothetical protein